MTKYFSLTTSNSSFTKRFRVISEGFSEELEKREDIQTTLEGSLDVSLGSVFRRWTHSVRVREEEDDSDYGTLEDLKRFYLYRDPTGTPTNILTLVDHLGDTYYVIFTGSLQCKPFATVLEGTEAWYYVNVVLLQTSQESEPTS